MTTHRLLPAALSLLFAVTAAAQAPPAPADGCAATPVDLAAAPAETPAEASPPAEAEARVREIVAAPGVHVVHFWAPWCDNSVNELRAGWYDLVEQNPEATFTFVTVWNDGASGRETMDRYALPARVAELTLPDPGPSADEAQRRRAFLGLPLTWIPSTWIFHENGRLAFALNAGEMDMATLQHLIDAAARNWRSD